MNLTSKKFISLFLVFSIMMLSVNLYAKERRGAKLLITKKDGQQIKGELITVKPNSLLLLDAEGKDVPVDIEDIRVIKIVRKSRASTGFAVGAMVGVLISIATYRKHVPASDPKPDLFSPLREIARTIIEPIVIPARITVSFGLIGLVIGAVAGVAGIDKKIQIEGMTDSEIQETLDKLRKKARIRDYK